MRWVVSQRYQQILISSKEVNAAYCSTSCPISNMTQGTTAGSHFKFPCQGNRRMRRRRGASCTQCRRWQQVSEEFGGIGRQTSCKSLCVCLLKRRRMGQSNADRNDPQEQRALEVHHPAQRERSGRKGYPLVRNVLLSSGADPTNPTWPCRTPHFQH